MWEKNEYCLPQSEGLLLDCFPGGLVLNKPKLIPRMSAKFPLGRGGVGAGGEPWPLGGMCFLLALGKACEHHGGALQRALICLSVPSPREQTEQRLHPPSVVAVAPGFQWHHCVPSGPSRDSHCTLFISHLVLFRISDHTSACWLICCLPLKRVGRPPEGREHA